MPSHRGAVGRGLSGAEHDDNDNEANAHEHVREVQRRRILTAMASVAAERGAARTTVAHVVARSAVSRRTFYELFGSCEECFLAAFDDAVARASVGVVAAYRAGGSWRERIRAALGAALQFLDEDPEVAALCVIGSLEVGPGGLERRARVLRALQAAVDEGRAEMRPGSQAPPLAAEGAVGAVFSMVHSRLRERQSPGERRPPGSRRSPAAGAEPPPSPQPLTELLNPLMNMIVLPYLGAAAARRELTRPLPAAPAPVVRPRADPLERLDMRLTYRTMRVLSAVADNAGASNRQVAGAAGIVDQGQISKLLARLEGLGLVRNTELSVARGGPNAWRLTPRGREVESAVRTQASRL